MVASKYRLLERAISIEPRLQQYKRLFFILKRQGLLPIKWELSLPTRDKGPISLIICRRMDSCWPKTLISIRRFRLPPLMGIKEEKKTTLLFPV